MNNVPEPEGPAQFAVPESPLENIVRPSLTPLTELSENNINPLSQYFNGAFVDIFHQNKFLQSLKTKDNKDWSGVSSNKQCEDFEWSQNQIVTLLEYYGLYPQLWDTKHEQYMNKDVRKQLITKLSEKVGAPEQAVNVKFQRLRVHFSRELRKEESSAHEAQPYQSKWKYYNNMLFLKDTLRCRQKSRQHNTDKDSLSLMMDMSSSKSLTTNNLIITNTCTISSDSGHSSPDSTSLVSPSVCRSENKENISPVSSRVPTSPLSPSLITAPFSTLSSPLVPPLLANNPLFSSLQTSLPTPPASLLSSFASLEHLLSPRMLAPLLMSTNAAKQDHAPFNPLINQTPGTLLAPTPHIPTSPLTPNVVCSAPSFWPTSSSVTSSREDEDIAALKSYQAKRQRVITQSGEGSRESMNDVTSPQTDGDLRDCDYFSLHVSESLRKMDIICAEECKRAIQNTLYQYIVKSCQRQPFLSPASPFHSRYPSSSSNVRMMGRKS